MFSRHLFKDLIPSEKAKDLLKEGARLLEHHDFEAARKVYQKIPLEDRNCKFVQGFFSDITNKEKMKKYTDQLIKQYKKSPL